MSISLLFMLFGLGLGFFFCSTCTCDILCVFEFKSKYQVQDSDVQLTKGHHGFGSTVNLCTVQIILKNVLL